MGERFDRDHAALLLTPLPHEASMRVARCHSFTTELEERERKTVGRRIKDARLSLMKTLDHIDSGRTSQVPATTVYELAPAPILNSRIGYQSGQ